MSSIWIPGLVVLAIAVAAGLIAARRLGRRSPSEEDKRLRVADLEQRREELYARLRDLPEDAAAAGERAALERAAAEVLRELDELGEVPAPAAAAAPVGAPASAPGRRSGVIGFVAGVVAMGTIALLVYFAGRDAAPGPPPPPQPRGAQTAGGLPADHPEVPNQLPAEMEERLASLAARVEAAPDDLIARKELALTQLSASRYVEAFEQAREIERRQPEDPDALFVQGVVRTLMGGNDEALDLLDRVLAQYPDHLQALFYRGVALFQSGQRERAIESWQRGLLTAGGSHPEFERVLAMANEASPATPAPTPAPEPSPPAVDRAPLPGAADGFPVRVELAPGARAQPGAIVFVSLRPEGGGPPVAVRRIEGARFPLELVLGAGDSMMGAELPASGQLSVRLDGDGSASTREPTDLEAEGAARRGTPLTLVLNGS